MLLLFNRRLITTPKIMKIKVLLLPFVLVLLFACKNETIIDEDADLAFVPTDVLVKTKPNFSIEEIFELINTLGHEVEYVKNMVYESALPPDSLDYVLTYLNDKPYMKSGPWSATGYVHAITHRLTIFPKFFQINNQAFQADWLETVQILQLTELTDKENAGYVIFLHVPEGEEKEWVTRFRSYKFVEWAHLNHIIELNPWP